MMTDVVVLRTRPPSDAVLIKTMIIRSESEAVGQPEKPAAPSAGGNTNAG